jgi:hypothetical protein
MRQVLCAHHAPLLPAAGVAADGAAAEPPPAVHPLTFVQITH